MRAWIFVLILLLPNLEFAEAASTYKRALDKKLNRYLTHGTIIGGKAGDGFSLIDIRRHYAKKTQTERIVFDLGDLYGKPLLNHVSFFTVNLEKAPPRLVIDLAQVQRSGVDLEKIRQLFKASPFVQSASILYDPEDASTTVVLDLKKKIELEVFKARDNKKPSRLVLDLRETKVKGI